MRPTIDYLNARRDTAQRKGKTSFRSKTGAVDDRAQWAQTDRHEQTMLQVSAVFAEFRSWVANLPPVGAVMSGVTLDDTF